MSFITEQEKKVAPLLKQSGVSLFVYFICIALGATLVAVFSIRSETTKIDWSDWGAISIIAATASACYLSIWLYLKNITKTPR